MKYALIPLIINLLSAVVQCQQKQRHEVNLIRRLNDFFAFDHNIFLLDRTLDPDRFVASAFAYDKIIPQSVYIVEDDSENNNTETTYVKKITSMNTLLIVGVDDFRNDSKVLAEVKKIQNSNVKIGVFFGRNIVTSMGLVEQLFRWSWSVGIVNIFGAFYKSIDDAAAFNVFRCDPFDKFELINVTGIELLQNYFPGNIPNYRQHPLTLVKFNEVLLKNLEVQFWNTVVNVFNASKSLANTSFYDYKLSELRGDILLHDWTLDMDSSEDIQVYPHRVNSIVLIVPHAEPYSGIETYLRNATWKLLFAYIFIVVAGAILLLTVSGYMHTKKVVLVQCVTDVINLLMNDNTAIRYGRLHGADVWVIVPLTFTGLIMVNGILSVFQSYLTVPIYGRQMKTFDDLFESTVPILSNEVGWASRFVNTLDIITKHGGWNDKVRPVKLALQTEELEKFNRSISATLTDYTARIYLEVQKQLKLNAYYLLDVALEHSFVIFLLNFDFPFIEPVSNIIHRLNCAGLMDKWRKDGDQLAILRLLKMNLNRPSKSINELDSAEFMVPTVVWCGWITSAILFAFEIIWNKFKPRFQPHIAKLKTMFSVY